MLQAVVGAIAGFAIGVVAALLGVAGGELLIPTLMLLFSADVKLAGTTIREMAWRDQEPPTTGVLPVYGIKRPPAELDQNVEGFPFLAFSSRILVRRGAN